MSCRILWINGAFGSGKTSVAHELQRRGEGIWIYDPEEAGYYLRRCQPKAMWLDNFQEEPLWRHINYHSLLDLAGRYQGVIVCPMTLTNPLYYDEIIGRLRREGVEVAHFLLDASRQTLLRRLKSRGEGEKSWAVGKIDLCLHCFQDPVFDNRISTDAMTIQQVATAIAMSAGIPLQDEPKSPFVRWLHRRLSNLRAMRWPFR